MPSFPSESKWFNMHVCTHAAQLYYRIFYTTFDHKSHFSPKKFIVHSLTFTIFEQRKKVSGGLDTKCILLQHYQLCISDFIHQAIDYVTNEYVFD